MHESNQMLSPSGGQALRTGNDFRTLRLQLGVPLTRLAEEVGVVPSTISSLESAARLRSGTLEKYLAGLARCAERSAAERLRERTEKMLALAATE
jgi:transcriptional regulator with XRE-family HTH domain